MKLFTSFILLLITFFVGVFPAFAQNFPKPTGYVNDYAHVYSDSFRKQLDEKLTAFEASSSAEVVVVTVNNLQNTTIEDYAVRLFEDWKIGKNTKDNGILVLIAKDEREVRIEVGYGLEGVINDARAGRIIRDDIIPSFKEGNYEAGTEKGVATVLSYIRGEPVAEAPASSSPFNWDILGEFFPLLIFGIMYLGSFLARSKEYYAGGIIGGIVGLLVGVVIGSMLLIVASTLILALVGLVLDFILSKNYQSLKQQHKSTDWWGSRGGFYGGGRSSSSGGGFGGFGGGSSGGGGASGKW